MIQPSFLVNGSSTALCLPMLSPKSRNHRYLCGPPNTQTRIWFSVRANWKKHLSLSQIKKDNGKLSCFCSVGVIVFH